MSSISSVGGYSAYSAYNAISSGGVYNRAADGASELAIQEKTNSQVKGLEAGSENLTSAKSAAKIADGALSGVEEFLQSIKEKSVKAMNGTLSDEDKQSIQDQIKEYMKGINDLASGTTFNEKNLLNKEGEMKVAADGNGAENKVSTYDSATKALGIDDYDVTKDDFDPGVIDKALEKVSSMRSETGAQTNGIEHALTYNSRAAMELNGYQMNKEEDNVVKANQELKTKQALDSYQAILQKKQQEDEAQRTMAMFA
jgi:flagellin